MAYQIPTGGIENLAVTGVKLANNGVTLDKLSADARKFSPYDSTPITSSTTIGTAAVNQYVFLGHSGTNYTVTIPAAGDVNDGDWFTFVADGSFSANDANTANSASVARAEIRANNNGTINGQDDQVFLVDPYSSITLVSFDSDWRIVNVSPGLRLLSSVDFNTPEGAIARRELSGITDPVTSNITAEPGEFIRVTSNFTTITLPLNPVRGDRVIISLEGNDVDTITVGRNGKRINGLEENLTIDIPWATVILRYSGDGTTNEWRIN